MFRVHFNAIIVPFMMFLIGIFTQILFGQIFTIVNIIPWSIGLILTCLALILLVEQLTIKKIDHLETKLVNIETNIGLKVQFIEDDIIEGNGYSYLRAAEVIEHARANVTIVSPWEPFAEYLDNIPNPILKHSRATYYKMLKSQIDSHKIDKAPFHRRIIQTPSELEKEKLVFKTDALFFDYLQTASEVQRDYPRSCHLRRANSYINLHFTIVDNKYVIIPIFSHDEKKNQMRYGALIFDDNQGDLVKCFEGIYQTLESRSKPITSEQLVAPKN